MASKAEELLGEANCGFVGINSELEICSGYDQMESAATMAEIPEWYDDNYILMPPEERAKLADVMIARWQRYREKNNGQ